MGLREEFLSQLDAAKNANPTISELLKGHLDKFLNKNEDTDGSSDSGDGSD